MTDAFTRQVQDFTKQAQEMFTAGKDAKVPENISAFAEDAIAKSRDAYHKFTAMAKDNAKVAEEVMLTTQAGAKSIGEKIVANTLANTEAAFEAAQAMARARTFPEIARLQANYLAAAVRRRRIAVEGTLRTFEQGYQADARNGWPGNDEVLRADQERRLSHGRCTAVRYLAYRRVGHFSFKHQTRGDSPASFLFSYRAGES